MTYQNDFTLSTYTRSIGTKQRLQAKDGQYPYGRNHGEHLILSTHSHLLALILQHYDPSVDYLFWKDLTMPDVYSMTGIFYKSAPNSASFPRRSKRIKDKNRSSSSVERSFKTCAPKRV